jgi:diaminopimelate decarboxylase
MINEHSIGKHLTEKILELVDAGKSPFYIYESKTIAKNCLQFAAIPYQPKSVHFAMMANSNPRFLRIIKQAGLKIFVNSILHLRLAQEEGFRAEEIMFASSAMDEKTMIQVAESRAKLVLDSLQQFELWRSLFPGTGVGIRCNIGDFVIPRKTTGGYCIGKESRLGFTIDSVIEMKGNPLVNGLHLYVGTNISEIEYFFECYKHIVKLAGLFPNLEYIDFGGGFGLGEKYSSAFDINTYSQKVTDLMENVSSNLRRQIMLILEPGRIIGFDAGFFVCKITDIKHRNQQQLIGVNASSVQFPRPLLYPDIAFHPVVILRNNHEDNNKNILSSIFGCSTYSRDYLARNMELPPSGIGDIVILQHAGSYCSSAHINFLGFPKAKEYFI